MVKVLDLFSGIGGFSLGFHDALDAWEMGKPSWTGFSDIDKFANEQYKKRFPDAEQLGDVKSIRYGSIPNDITILFGGFPCQAFSMAGRRKGFMDTRGTLFFEIARILRDFIDNKNPIPCFLLENVKGLLSHDNGRTFATIHRVLTDLDYTVECQVVNTKWFLPQNRERIFIFGRYLGNPSGRKVFPIGESGKESNNRNTEVANCLQHPGHSGGNYRGMTMVKVGNLYKVKSVAQRTRNYKGEDSKIEERDDDVSNALNSQPKDYMVKIPEATKQGYAIAEDGDSINLSVPDSKTRRGRIGKGVAQTLDTGMQQYTIAKSRIRRLTPVECERLQGFPYGWTEGQSDTQRYKQLGNAVSVPVIEAICMNIIRIHMKDLRKEMGAFLTEKERNG